MWACYFSKHSIEITIALENMMLVFLNILKYFTMRIFVLES
jgi:hypothetical protein